MTYNLSASRLNLFQDCPRCFWLAMIKNVKRPSGPMSSIPIKMDSIIKNYFDKYRAIGELPPIIAGQVTGRLPKDMPKTLQHEEDNGILLSGRCDDYIELEDGAMAPFDHKTKSRPPKDIHPAYRLQLDVYSYLMQMNDYKTANKAFLAYYHPDFSDLHNGMRIYCTVIEVITNPDHVQDIMLKARDVLNGSMPEPGENCGYCRWVEKILDI